MTVLSFSLHVSIFTKALKWFLAKDVISYWERTYLADQHWRRGMGHLRSRGKLSASDICPESFTTGTFFLKNYLLKKFLMTNMLICLKVFCHFIEWWPLSKWLFIWQTQLVCLLLEHNNDACVCYFHFHLSLPFVTFHLQTAGKAICLPQLNM